MIKSKLELKFYIASDRIMNGFPAKRNLIQILKEFVSPQKDILRFLRLLRKVQYYNSKKGLLSKLISILIKIRYNRTSQKLGFSIDYSSFGYGLVIPTLRNYCSRRSEQNRKLCGIAYIHVYCWWRENYWRRIVPKFGIANYWVPEHWR